MYIYIYIYLYRERVEYGLLDGQYSELVTQRKRRVSAKHKLAFYDFQKLFRKQTNRFCWIPHRPTGNPQPSKINKTTQIYKIFFCSRGRWADCIKILLIPHKNVIIYACCYNKNLLIIYCPPSGPHFGKQFQN